MMAKRKDRDRVPRGKRSRFLAPPSSMDRVWRSGPDHAQGYANDGYWHVFDRYAPDGSSGAWYGALCGIVLNRVDFSATSVGDLNPVPVCPGCAARAHRTSSS